MRAPECPSAAGPAPLPRAIAANPLSFLKVWHIPQTGEVFATYEDYLNRFVDPHPRSYAGKTRARANTIRMDFYKQVCLICPRRLFRVLCSM